MRARWVGLALALACAPGGSGEDEGTETAGTTEADEPGVRVVGQVDVIELCGVDGAKVVSFRARRIGCVPGPPAPCTIPVDPYQEIVGDAATCPASHTALDMRVVIESPGRYQIEAQALTEGGYVGRCFGPGGADEVAVTQAQIDERAGVAVAARAGPCVVP